MATPGSVGALWTKRSEPHIMLDVLREVARGSKRTRIMYAANLSHAMLRRYLDGLLSAGFVVPHGEAYQLTAKGRLLRQDLERLLAHFEAPAEDGERYSPDRVPTMVPA